MFRRSIILPLMLAGMMIASACNAPASTPQPTAGAATQPTAAQPTTAATNAGGADATTADQGACTAEAANKPMPTGNMRLVIGTGGTGGVFYPYGGGVAKVITEKMGNAEATAEVTGGSVDNMKLKKKKNVI